MVAYWLIKTEPDHDWSWQEQVAKGTEGWDGVRNFAARNNIKAMKKGDQAFFYHSGKERRIMGIVKVVREEYPDKTDSSGRFVMVDVATDRPFKQPVTLKRIKEEISLANMQLVRISRLSVQSVSKTEWKLVCKLGGVKP